MFSFDKSFLRIAALYIGGASNEERQSSHPSTSGGLPNRYFLEPPWLRNWVTIPALRDTNPFPRQKKNSKYRYRTVEISSRERTFGRISIEFDVLYKSWL